MADTVAYGIPGTGLRDRSSAARGARVAMLVTAALAAAITAYQLTRPGELFGVTPDVSAWLGGAIRMVHGAVPYRDFDYTQPPGFVVLSAPFALLSEAVGTRDGLAVLRLTTPALAALLVLLTGGLVRGRGAVAVLTAGSVAGLLPAELYALRGGLLEPVAATLCLAGAAVLFREGRAGGSRRALAGGALLGLAVAVKLPAVIPALVAVAVVGAAARERLRPLVAGVAAGFAVPTLPFFALSPSGFIRDVVLTQLGRIPPAQRTPLGVRLGDVTGASAFGGGTAVSVAVAVAIVAVVAAAFLGVRRRPSPLEWFVIASAGLAAAAQLAPARYLPHYAAFVAPFLGLLLGLCAARLAERVSPRAVAAVAGVVAAALLVNQTLTLHGTSVPDVAADVDAVVPAGSCTLSDAPSLLVTGDRFVAAAPGCTAMTDPEGATLSYGPGTSGSAELWLDAFRHADYVVTQRPVAGWYIDATPSLLAYVEAHFHVVPRGDVIAYVRDSPG